MFFLIDKSFRFQKKKKNPVKIKCIPYLFYLLKFIRGIVLKKFEIKRNGNKTKKKKQKKKKEKKSKIKKTKRKGGKDNWHVF